MLGPATATFSGDEQMQSDQNSETKHTIAYPASMLSQYNIEESCVFPAISRAPASLRVELQHNSLDAISRITLKIDEVLDFARKWGSCPVVDFDVMWHKILWSVDIVCQLIEVITTPGNSIFNLNIKMKRFVAIILRVCNPAIDFLIAKSKHETYTKLAPFGTLM